MDRVDVLHAEHSRVTGLGSRESLSCWEGVLKNVQQEMLNLECAKNRPAKNTSLKIAVWPVSHWVRGETAKNRKF